MGDTIRNVPITVQASNIRLGAALPARVQRGVVRISSKYFGWLNGASVYFRREGRSYRCAVNIDVGAFKIVTGAASAYDCYFAFFRALRKAAKRLRRMKRMFRDDKRRRPTRIQRSSARRQPTSGRLRDPIRDGSNQIRAAGQLTSGE
jgi:ribosome-associated translation inhibitor RaiA